jgi:beta-phosphoglucomutase-like phosphatase (HAD superfamily)/dTDP-glucose pyrophosphorylase
MIDHEFFNHSVESFEFKSINLGNNKTIELYEFSNLDIKNNLEEDVINIDDDVFIAFLDDKVHHLLLDEIAQYEYIKTLYPNLKILFFKNKHYKESKFADFIFEQYSSFDKVYDFDKENLHIKKFIAMFQTGSYESVLSGDYIRQIGVKSEAMSFREYVEKNLEKDPFKILNITPVQLAGMKILIDKFKNLIPKTQNKKIYISRTLANLKHKESNSIERNLRVYEDEHIIEKYFVDLGYESVHLETLDPYDQIKLMRDADEVAGLQGTGMLLTSFCDPGTYVFDISVIKEFKVSYFECNFLSGIKHQQINLYNLNKEQFKSALHYHVQVRGNQPRLIIFDLDGVLIDSKEIHYKSLNEALLDIDKKYVISKEDHVKIFEGLSTNKKLEILTQSTGLPESLYNKIWADKQEKSIQFFNSLKNDEDLIDAMRYIKSNNIKIAVASNSIRKTVEACLNNLGIMEFVDLYLSNESVLNIKPSPDIYIKCMDHFNFDPKDVVIVEDSYIGKVAALHSKARLRGIGKRSELTHMFINNIIRNEKMDINVLIPMAGEGRRMRESGWNMPKPMIPIKDKTMIQTVVENIGLDECYNFIIKKEDMDLYKIDEHINTLSLNKRVLVQDKLESQEIIGAAPTTLVAKDYINTDNPLLIVNSDQYVVWDKSIIYDILNSGVDGCIFSFKDTDPKWSFSKLNKEGFVSAVSEKNPISDNASCGIYFWRKGSDYVKYAEQMIEKGIKTNNEFYVCPVYNEAIQDGKIISISMVEEMHGLGTPEDLNLFLKNIDEGIINI